MPLRPTPFAAPLLALGAALLAGCSSLPWAAGKTPDGARANVAILETTDVHANVLSYDYYKLKPDPSLGYERTATLIRRARAEFPNTFLFDSGDTIQGSVLADYQALVKPVTCDQELAIYQAMDAMGYDGGTAGNHEFNYGLRFLSQVTGTPMNVDGGHDNRCAGPRFPLVLANVYSARDGKPIFKPWTVVTKNIEVYTADGSKLSVPLKVGIIGFTPPPIMDWDKQNLAGKVTVSGVVEAARKYLPELKAQHPDLIVAILHGGLNTAPYTPDMENAGWHLAGVPGIDALLLGHSHAEFPGPRYAGLKEVDAQRGLVRGVPAVMADFFGKDLGMIQLVLDRKDGRWVVDREESHSEVRRICPQKNDCVPADPAIAPLVQQAHAAAIAYVNTPIGESTLHMSSHFADEGNMTALAPVNAAQADYVRNELPRSHPELAGVPVLSAAAAFRTGFGGPDDYTDVAPGPLTLRSAADLYFYPNTLAAVKTDGAGVKAWLEKSAERFNRIDPAKAGEQVLINSRFTGYNFDQIQGGIRYVIDVSKPAGQRITTLTFQGKPVEPDQPFIVVTNNYRASGGGHFPGLDGSNIVLAAPDGTREILAKWLERHKQIGAKDLEPTSWNFAPLKTRGPVVFTDASGKQDVARAAGLGHIRQLKDHGDGTATYAIDLSR
ncbi:MULTISPECIES: bifunctional 2',3'-cyclic-nucleotide 2'-phosphodiesterase/3'-nucleotidase [unclassified Rhodanobacter]|uniref:bifunctional 2',3'-cyclic-nucleotide 2'-phosphodiesterase/3'-nucleotidase n=1 Tax=unclassified Rhodanobacter TaxID=2621553 RepID=UPI001BDF3E50|nr:MULTISPECIES: bifunctional 2',3'-cyclic-nucleotide 2'-phosphodiesterase/3'-nucleotidase [unclassified Rhodanobacter]MBT2143868.1 bifunctional 2',3'-cyclic-nucleotide 2'-phosphodiesterase/3'-nucleotidase [Rhodanobacter sp. LX-99]MBT2147058.1 bifunctional 2',3'-cyclic-nucleotide 2'-phosphodiesterase/3'-nucleotidase [Rhodanobacter sp. LX-100]